VTKMRKGLPLLSVFILLLSIPSASVGQIIENPSKPRAKDAGRVLKLTEVWRITDEGGDFYFQAPRNLQTATDGSIFITDNDEFLRFSADGKFIGNIFKKGQGPGEIGGSFMYFIQGPDVFIQDLNSWRFWRADFNGVFQEQIVIKNKDISVLIGVVPDGFLFIRMVWPPRSEWTGRMLEVLHSVESFAEGSSDRRDIATFKTNAFLSPRSATNWDSSITALSPDGKSLYAFFGREYQIEIVNLDSSPVVKRFRRTYPRVPHVEKSWESESRKKNGYPKIEYEADIKGLYPIEGRVWVETSTEDKIKGRLIDVFDKDGHFIDGFYLGPGRSLMAVREGYIFCQEKNEDETITIVKYRIIH
jgi:hypothetical protein